jgi:hypothetical protein
MAGTEEQIEIDLGDMPKVEEPKAEEPTIEIIDENAPVEAVAQDDEENPQDVEKALKKLKKKVEKEKEGRLEAERRAKELEIQAQHAMNKASENDFHLVRSAIDRLNLDQDMLKAQLRDSMAIGDFDKAAEIQAAMVSNTTNLNQLERGLEEMKNAPRQPVQPQQRNTVDVDDLIGRVTPRSAEWLRKNKDALPDERSIRIMGRAHEDAVDMGIIPESDEYFSFVEGRLGIGNRKNNDTQGDDAMSGAAKVTKNRQSPPSAPVSRNPVNSEGTRPGVIRLTAAEVEAAKISGISPQEYYRLKMDDRNRN